MTEEDASALQAKQDELMVKLDEFGALTRKIQELLKLGALGDGFVFEDEPEPPSFDMEIDESSLPKVIICGSMEHIPRIVVCDPAVKKEGPSISCRCTQLLVSSSSFNGINIFSFFLLL